MNSSIHDVAKRAGVSISTVSRVLNNSAGVKESKVKAVEEAMKYYDYQPSQFGRGLVTGNSNMIGVYSPIAGGEMFENRYLLECLRGFDQAISNSKYSLLLINETEDYYIEKNKRPKFLEYVNQHRIDGLLVVAIPSDGKIEGALSAIMDQEFPVGYIGKQFHKKGLNAYAQYEDYTISALRQLYMEGHRYILLYAEEFNVNIGNRIKSKVETLYKNLKIELNFSTDEKVTAKSLLKPLEETIKQNKCTAIVGGSVNKAAKIVSALNSLELKVPDDISVICVEHRENEGREVIPRLDCYYVPAMEMGNELAQRLIEKLNGEKEILSTKIYNPQYIKRQSVKCLK